MSIDHEGKCREQMLKYMVCVSKNEHDNSKCRLEAKDYLSCRMNNNLMEKQDLDSFGYQDLKKDSS